MKNETVGSSSSKSNASSSRATTASKGKSKKRIITAYDHHVHNAARILWHSVDSSLFDIVCSLYKTPRTLDALVRKADFEGDAASDELRRAYKAKDGTPAFLAACRLWLDSLRLADTLWNPVIEEADRKREEKQRKKAAPLKAA